MAIWPFSLFLKKAKPTPAEPAYREYAVYVRSDETITDINDALRISMTLSNTPVWSHGVEVPQGSFIAPSQFERLPDDLKRFFKPVLKQMRLRL